MKATETAIDPLSTPESKGKRLAQARHLAGLFSVQSLVDKLGNEFDISFGGWRNWESGIANGLSPKGASKAIKILEKRNIFCSIEWLLHGIGKGPRILKNINSDREQTLSLEQYKTEKNIIQELLFFRTQNKNVIDMIVPDNSMSPRFIQGEYIAGMLKTGNSIQELISKDCIIETVSGNILLRNISEIHNDLYTLACHNSNTTEKPFLHNIKIRAAAAVIWQRRQDK